MQYPDATLAQEPRLDIFRPLNAQPEPIEISDYAAAREMLLNPEQQ